MFYVSFAGLGIGLGLGTADLGLGLGLEGVGLGLGLVTAGLDYYIGTEECTAMDMIIHHEV